jgi:imidazole glycerol-phosphate synthase subunit HisH
MTTSAAGRVTLLDYGVGNTASVRRAFLRLGAEVDFTSDPERVASADRIVLPGVGAFAPARERLSALGLDAALAAAVGRGARLLGLCLGYQLLFEESEEFGVTTGLGFLKGRVVPFRAGVRVPHVGWNLLDVRKSDGLFAGLPPGSYVYFVHSFVPEGADPADVAAVTEHGVPFAAAAERGNVWGCQFHPEKSSGAGRRILSNFLGKDAA